MQLRPLIMYIYIVYWCRAQALIGKWYWEGGTPQALV